MLEIEQMMCKNNITDINNVSIELYRKFFNEILCNRIFIYTTIEGLDIKLLFNETDFMHILGAQHILGEKYKSTKFNEEIENGTMTFEYLNKRNSIQFIDDINRFLGFSNIYYILTNCNAIYFDKDIFKNNVNPKRNSNVDYKYILFQDIHNKKLHIGLDTYNKGRTYYAKSLLVTSELNDKFLENQKPLYITNINIVDKKTKSVIENIKLDEVAAAREASQ